MGASRMARTPLTHAMGLLFRCKPASGRVVGAARGLSHRGGPRLRNVHVSLFLTIVDYIISW